MSKDASESAEPVSPLQVALGAVPLEVTFRDGRKQTVAIQLHVPDEYEAYLQAQGDGYALAEFAAKQPAGWGRELHPASLLDVQEKSMDLNFPSVRRWAELRTRQLELAQALKLVPAGSSRSPRPSGS